MTHRRFDGLPAPRSFSNRMTWWLTDLDDADRRGRLARLLRSTHPADHLGDPAASLRHNIDHFLSLHGVELHGGKVLMLSQARGLGHVFDPVTAYWCHSPAGDLVCLVLEVRNTFGDRYCYLLRLDRRGRAGFDKRLYVSPFFPVDGHYRCRATLTTESLYLRVALHREPGRPALVAVVTGVRTRGFWPGVLADLLNPITTRWTTARVHGEAWRLRALGLPVRRRRRCPSQPGVSPRTGRPSDSGGDHLRTRS